MREQVFEWGRAREPLLSLAPQQLQLPHTQDDTFLSTHVNKQLLHHLLWLVLAQARTPPAHCLRTPDALVRPPTTLDIRALALSNSARAACCSSSKMLRLPDALLAVVAERLPDLEDRCVLA
jgi:hypothetical protein